MIIGFNLKKILIERGKVIRGEVKVNTRMDILGVKKEEAKLTSGKDILSFEFTFVINYKSVEDHIGDVASIIFEGNVLYLADPKDTKKILDDWKNKEISSELRVRILNTILAKCNVKALVLEEDMGLPPHLPLPKFSLKQTESKEEKKKK